MNAKQLKIDLSIPVEGGPLDGHAVVYDYDRDPVALPEIMPTGLIPSRGLVIPVAPPAGYQRVHTYRLKENGRVYRWELANPSELDPKQDEVRARLVLALGIDPNATLTTALEEAYRLSGCNNGALGKRHLAQNSDGYCTGCGHYFRDDDHLPYAPATLAEAVKRALPYRVRVADQSVFDRHRAVADHGRLGDGVCPTPDRPGMCGHDGRPKVCLTCCDSDGNPVPAPCLDFVDLARRYGFDPEEAVAS